MSGRKNFMMKRGEDQLSKFPHILRELRKRKKITQNQLAHELGFGYTAISNYESGRNEPSIDTLLKISDYFDVPVGMLLGESSEKRLINKHVRYIFENYMKFNDEEKKYLIYTVKFLSANYENGKSDV